MPDVKPPPPYDYPSTSSAGTSAGSPAGCASPLGLVVDMEPCIADLPLSPDPLSSFGQRRPGLAQYPAFYAAPYPLMARCNSSTLLTNLGVRCCSGRLGSVGAGFHEGRDPGSPGYAGGTGKRPYRSMENLNWSSMADARQCGAPYRSVDSEFILRYTSTSHWCGAAPDGSMARSLELMPGPESLAFYPRHVLPRKDLPLFPQLLFPASVDEWDARKGLRDKLRLQSARSSLEPLKPLPLRAQATPCAAGPRPPCGVRLTSPEEIKQEVLRRLQLRRQNSSPDLTRHGCCPRSPGAVKGSRTTDNVAGGKSQSDGAPERSRAPAGRLHIPTFEEFKRMRQKEGEQSNDSTAAGPVAAGKPEAAELNGSLCPSDPSESNSSRGDVQTSEVKGEMSKSDATGSSGDAPQTASWSEGPSHGHTASSTTAPASTSPSSPSSVSSTYSPIRTGPSPRSPLQSQASSAQERAAQGGDGRRRRCSLEPAGSVPFPPGRENWGRPASCCPALLLEGTDLSSYGAKIYKMKDGLIGSALDLIKKRLVGGRVSELLSVKGLVC